MTIYVTKRIYDTASKDDGYRVLVDRLWPRGVSKERANLDEWAKDVAPTTELRKWFNHDPDKYKEFCKRYEEELKENRIFLEYKNDWSKRDKVTLLFGAKDTVHNEASVLKNILDS